MAYFRIPRTKQEKSQWYNVEDFRRLSFRIKARSRRSPANLVDAWDDILRSPWNRRSWKYYRAKQYRSRGG